VFQPQLLQDLPLYMTTSYNTARTMAERSVSSNAAPPEASVTEQAAFLHSVAHELSTPLTPIVGYVKILLSGKLGALTEKQTRILESVAQSAEHLSQIIDNLVDFADLEAGSSELHLTELDLAALLDRCLEEIRPQVRAKRIVLERLVSAPAVVRADEGKLRQAIHNLLDNAIKFSTHGGMILAELAPLGDGRVELSIYDQGSGMDAGALESLSRPFRHAASAYPARKPGAGLGLPVSRCIAEAHGGELRAESPPRSQPLAPTHQLAGTRASLILPLAPRI
jgi:signal transduction histidine kinase